MNLPQKMLYNFVIERTVTGREEEAKALMDDAFARQEAKTFNAAYLAETTPKLLALIKPEFIEDVKKKLAGLGGLIK